MLFVFGNQQLDALIETTHSRVFVDEPDNPQAAADYLNRATEALLSSDCDAGECGSYDDYVLETLESIINEFLIRLTMPFANVDLLGYSTNPYDYFLILEINDGCLKPRQPARHRELLALRKNAEHHSHRLQWMQAPRYSGR